MNFDYEKDNKKLPMSLRQFLAMPNRVTKQDQSHFLRLFAGNEQRAIRNNLNAAELASGFIPQIHYSNVITGIAPILKNRLVSKIAGRVFIEGNDESLKQVKEKFKESYLTKVLKKAFDNSITTGRNVMVVDFEKQVQKAKIRNFDLFRTKLYFDSFDELVQADLFLNDYSTNIFEYYIVIERRYFNSKNKPCQKIIVTKVSWDNKGNTSIVEYDKIDKVPAKVKNNFKDITFFKEAELENFINLGVFPIDNTISNSKYPYSNIPESQFLDLQDLIVELDVTRTNKNVDQELGRGRALVPEFMNLSNTQIGGNNHNIASHLGGGFTPGVGVLKDTIITRYPTKSIDDNKPTSIQFDLRTDQWRHDIEGTIGDICSAFGMTVLDYDPRLLQQGQRTDDEINAMTDITRATVMDKREIAEDSINSMLELISVLYGLKEPMFIRWSMRSILNPSKNTSLIGQQLANGTISQVTAIKRENPDFTDKEVQEELEKIKAETQAKAPTDPYNF